WGLLAPKPLGVFRYRLLRSVPDNRLHFYLELAAFTKMHVHITSGDARRKKDIFIQNRAPQMRFI
ncbi:MAG: hypothetical protein KIC78_12640, partial [Prevotella sp.]|uniref:hypothetical protein n=1 Tax=Prevotella sp. TaxID=59823 RepID=UPI002579FAEB